MRRALLSDIRNPAFGISTACALVLFIAGPTSAAADPDLAFSGYYKNMLALSDARGNYRHLALTQEDYLLDDYERLRLKAEAGFGDHLGLLVHYEVMTAWGDATRVQQKLDESGFSSLAGISPSLNMKARERFLDLEKEVLSESNFTLDHQIDRLAVTMRADDVELSLGRQAVSWGTGLIWNPTDLFSGFSPTEIDRDEKAGVDVARLTAHFAQDSSVDLVVEPLDVDAPYRTDANDSSAALRITTHFGEYDLALVGGFIASDVVVGGDFVGYLGDAGVRGEWLYTRVEEEDERDYFRALIGMDYSFAAKWDPYVAVEYFYNGIGAGCEEDYISRLEEESVIRAFGRGNAYNVARHYVGTVVRVQPSALTSMSALTLWNVVDGSVREYASASWSTSDNTELILGANLGLGDLGDEFEGWSKEQAGVNFRHPDFYFAYFKWYF
ncbi:MAG: hypothetical protein KJ626_03810 [Verrucomicrobia bacterium]|nr:hypothetical protein [Verrucomicrobiota bacterium]